MQNNDGHLGESSDAIAEGKATIDDVLNFEVSLETDIMDFLLIAGWDYWYSPIYDKADKNLKEQLREHVKGKKAELSRRTKIQESRFYKACMFFIPYGGYSDNKLKTLGDLKNIVETQGFGFRHIGYKSLSHFNDALKQYGIDPIRVGGKYATENMLRKYGLELAKR